MHVRLGCHCGRALSQSNFQIPHAQSQVGQLLSISLGVSSVTPGTKNQLLDFIHMVDRRLYLSKRSGRNYIIAQG
ncbi:diguanylate cyclase domain-containing protein [Cellvibrio japonicus]|uniref:diguanylate cyclase domain-containing protein n=1 Tax=Cellvibrio japonicus TaxID=155077 RepID=UPI0019309E7C|nr:diguanylate cyclase [Cellvibrio japonicus]